MEILKDCDFSFHFLINCISEAIKNKNFLDPLKLSNIVPVHKKKQIIDQSVYYLSYQKFLKK